MQLQQHRPTLAARSDLTKGIRRGEPLLWLGSGALLFFLLPFVGTDLLGLQPDLYYLGYFTAAVAFFTAFVLTHASALRPLWTEGVRASLLIGALTGAVLAVGIFAQAASSHPDGWRYGFQIVWRGLVYGAVDAAILYVFPAAVAYLLMHRYRQGLSLRAAFAGLALVLSLLMTTTYHVGYAEYRDSTLRYPLIGALVANVPTAVTGNPLGAVATHVAMHVSAVVHQNDGGTAHLLPPRLTGDYPSHGSSDLAAGLAAGWLLACAALTLSMRRQARGRDPGRRPGR